MSRYDGLIIPRSYSEYINKTDAATLLQALQLSGVMDNAPTAQSTKPAKSGGIFAASAVIMASGATFSGVAISAGSVVRVLFTADLTGSDTTTGLQLTYNSTAYVVKVGKDGALEALTAHLIEESYIYLQAYTTLELAFDGSQFVVMGNPVVISNADFSIMADGSITYTKTIVDTKADISNFGKIQDAVVSDDDLKTYKANMFISVRIDSEGLSGIPYSESIWCGFLNFTQGRDQGFQIVLLYNVNKIYYRNLYGIWGSWTALN